MNSPKQERIFKALDSFAIELPSWGFANTGTRFGKFVQDGAATTTDEKLADAGQVHAFTGCCPRFTSTARLATRTRLFGRPL
jgi:L-rhamnose isomerase/sugar isomerase